MNARVSSRSGEDDDGLTAAERTAAEWLVRRQNGLNAREEQEFLRWLNASPENAEVYAETAEASSLLDQLRVPQLAPAVSERRGGNRWATWMAAAAAFAALALVWRHEARQAQVYDVAASTQVGGFKKLALPDGSQVLLNTNSRIHVAYTADERRILLEGEAYFQVEKDPSRPFWVQSGSITVRALGTAFDVRVKQSTIDVLVTEGKVRVADQLATTGAGSALSGIDLSKGHSATVKLPSEARAAEPIVVSDRDSKSIENALAWQEGRLVFSETPLSEIVLEFNRYNSHKIEIADPVLASRKFGGSFAATQIEPLLELLEQSFGVVAEERGDTTVLRLGAR